MKRAKKGLAAILSTCMLLSLLPAAAFAEGAPAADTLEEAAQPTTVEKTLAEMFADAQDGETLRLEQDVTVTGQEDADYKNSGTVTLDLNGHTITGDNKNIALRAIGTEAGKGTLKITNGTIKTNSGTYCTVGAKDAALELSDMRLENSTAYGCSVKAFAGGTIDLKKVCSTSQTGGGVEAAGGTVNIYDSTFTQTGYYDHNSVNLAASGGTGTVNVYGGSFTSENYGLYIFSSGGTINVYDGTFKAGEEKAVVKADLDLNSYPAATANINIYGGDFTGKIDIADKEEVHVEITGGTFADTGLTKEAFSAYTAEGTVVTEGPDGTFTVKELDETNGVAEVGGRYYASLQKAVDNAGKGETVTLLQDTAEDIVIPEGAELTLNLNGKTLANHENHTITNKGTLTITGGGTVDNVTHARAAIQNEPGGNVVLNGGAYTRSKENGQNAEASGGNSYYNIVNHGTMEINSGVSVTQNGQFSSMIENGWYNGSQNTGGKNSVLTINGGTFSGGLNTIKNDDYGELVINDGTFTSMSQAAFLNWNVATVNGGTFDAAGASNGVILNGYIDGTMDQGKLTINGGTFNAGEKTVITTMGGGTHSGDIEITGGTLNGSIVLTDSSEGARLTITQKAKVNGNVTNSGKADVAITDGATVDGQVSNSAGGTMSVVNSTIGSVPEGTTAETIVIVNSTVDGTLTTNTAENAAVMVGGKTYETLGAAITAAKAGDTIYVLKDIPEAAGIAVPSGKNFTIDFGGHAYTLKDPGAGSAGTESNGFQFLKDSTITLKNGTVRIAEGTISIKRIIQNYANLTLEDMHFFAEHQADGEDYALSFNNGSIIFKGDTDIVTTSDEAIAFDVCKYSSYPSTNVTFDESYTGTINGKIVYDSTVADTHKLTIQGNGTFGAIEAASGAAEAAKSGIEVTSGHFAKPVNEDYLADSVKAQLESASNPEAPYSYYPSLEAAQAAAQPGDTITEVNATTGGTKYTVTLDYADGEMANSLYTVTEGTKLTLPTPSRSGYTFEGWYDGSSRVSSPYKVMKDVTLTAEWDYNGSSSSSGSTRYTVSVEDTDNGSVEVSPTRAS
ncbi:InlB B-repeat-containing protein, partial [Flavonifractor plautii]|uniref:InlB B-repeat-containing protein n=1 Tax=Flavonifractor plautii TaxID=292800 RepID=UPI0018AC0D76